MSITHGSGAPILQVHKSVESRDEFSLCFSDPIDAKEWHDAISDEIKLCDTLHEGAPPPRSPRRPYGSDVVRSTFQKALSLSPQRRALSSPSLGGRAKNSLLSEGVGRAGTKGPAAINVGNDDRRNDEKHMARSSSKRRAFV